MARTNKVILIAGTRGTGKTDFLKNLIVKMAKKFPKALVVDTFNSDVWRDLSTHDFPDRVKEVPIIPLASFPRWKKGIGRMFSADTDQLMQLVQNHAKNTFIIFEDATKYIGSRLTADVRHFVLDSKQKNLDLVFVFHSLTAIPAELLRVADILVLFKTNDAKAPNKFDSFPEIEEMLKKTKESTNRYVHLTTQLN